MKKRNMLIECGCGCKEIFYKYDNCGRERKFKLGHYMRIKNETHVKNIRNALLGRILSKEWKLKIGEGNRGKKISEEHKRKISNALTGIKRLFMSQEHRRKISEKAKERLKFPENNPNWKGGITKEWQLIRNSNKYKEWRTNVFIRDDYTCQLSGKSGGKLEVHHIESFCNNINKRFCINNGIVLDKQLHKWFHNLYGNGNNTKEQFEEFKSYF